MGICKIEGCEKEAKNEVCSMHRARMQRHGSYDPPPTAEQRFWKMVDRNGPNGCWLWTGGKTGSGYGRIDIDEKGVRAHRFSYELDTGINPGKLQVLHKCDNPPCVNPEHLFLGTIFDNMRDCALKKRNCQQKKTHCPKGHPLEGDNLVVGYLLRKNRRTCRTCRNIQNKARPRCRRKNCSKLDCPVHSLSTI
jgi:hypothetical protein